MAAGSRLRALTELEVERLNLSQRVPRPPEPRGRELVEVPRVLGLLFGKHAAFSRADAGACELRTPCERGLRLLRQRAERHVRDEERDVEEEWLTRVRSDADFRT